MFRPMEFLNGYSRSQKTVAMVFLFAATIIATLGLGIAVVSCVVLS